jgi:hypothetical protein
MKKDKNICKIYFDEKKYNMELNLSETYKLSLSRQLLDDSLKFIKISNLVINKDKIEYVEFI